MVPCPGRIEIGERSVPNYNEFSLGTVPMATAFARSCNTSFAKLASEMQPDTLTTAAAQFGIGQDYNVVGLPIDSGSVPPASDLVQRTEEGFGQGKVVVSQFGMAMAAATVANGSTPVPQLISGRETTIDGERPAISPAMVDGLRGMMRLVVTSGTAERVEDQGEVYGKTGEAEVEGGSHAVVRRLSREPGIRDSGCAGREVRTTPSQSPATCSPPCLKATDPSGEQSQPPGGHHGFVA